MEIVSIHLGRMKKKDLLMGMRLHLHMIMVSRMAAIMKLV